MLLLLDAAKLMIQYPEAAGSDGGSGIYGLLLKRWDILFLIPSAVSESTH